MSTETQYEQIHSGVRENHLTNSWLHGYLIPGCAMVAGAFLRLLKIFFEVQIYYMKFNFEVSNSWKNFGGQTSKENFPRIWNFKIKFHKVNLHFEKYFQQSQKSSSHHSGRVAHPGIRYPWSFMKCTPSIVSRKRPVVVGESHKESNKIRGKKMDVAIIEDFCWTSSSIKLRNVLRLRLHEKKIHVCWVKDCNISSNKC